MTPEETMQEVNKVARIILLNEKIEQMKAEFFTTKHHTTESEADRFNRMNIAIAERNQLFEDIKNSENIIKQVHETDEAEETYWYYKVKGKITLLYEKREPKWNMD